MGRDQPGNNQRHPDEHGRQHQHHRQRQIIDQLHTHPKVYPPQREALSFPESPDVGTETPTGTPKTLVGNSRSFGILLRLDG